jgi:hypothetical protein
VTLIVLLFGFAATLAWLAFTSWIVGNLAFKEEPPVRRAALTAGTSALVTLAFNLAAEIALPNFFSLAALLFIIPAAACDFLMLRRGFLADWVSDEEVGEVFS